MKLFLDYIRHYLQQTDKKSFILVSLFCAALLFLNYYFHLHTLIEKNSSVAVKLIAWYTVFLAALGVPLWVLRSRHRPKPPCPLPCRTLLLLAPLVVALKFTLSFRFRIVADGYRNEYWNKIISWPLFLLLVLLILYGIRQWISKEESFFGTRHKVMNWKPYGILVLIMLPLLVLAANQADFQSVYPQFKNLSVEGNTENIPWWKILLFEGSYGTDFISTELIFRGFLVLAFVKWMGRDIILPAAVFYCSFHFGKPAIECISSFFGGILLGIIVYNTRSIRGVLAVHLGMAWMMEVVGWLVGR